MALMPTSLDPRLPVLLLMVCLRVTAWPLESGAGCPSSEWSVMCRPCCEYQLIQCRCPAQPGVQVGYTVPCCRNALDQCDPCIIHPGCSLFENCKSCNNGTWKSNDDFFVRGTFCKECRQGWSGGDCKACGGVLQRAYGTIALESYPTNARCEWRVKVNHGHNIELRFSSLSLESDHHCGYDYIELRDGDSVSSPVLGRFCGPELPPPVRTTGNNLHILFVSDGYTNLDGFVLTYQQSSAARNAECRPPEKPEHGDVLPAYGPGHRLLSVSYVCHPTFTLVGSEQRTCLLNNATWTGTQPKCVKVSRGHCAPPPRIPHGYQKRVSARSGGGSNKMEFSCKGSYILSGEPTMTCLSNGSWSSRPPQCVRACREPKVSQLVTQTVLKPHQRSKPDDVSSAWPSTFKLWTSDRQPKSEDTGLPALPRGFHHLHTSLEYSCSSPLYQHSGSSRRTCLKTGKWTGRHVSCSPVCGKVTSFDSQNPSGMRWPWHAAIYIRSPDAAGGGGGVNAPGGQQGLPGDDAGEEAAAWRLVCSGALVTQRSVLVAAHCVVTLDIQQQHPLHPDHVRVVLGMLHANASEEQAKVLQRLRVSSIFVHPEFKSVLDSDLAMLRLQDKVRISRRVSPVCLPRMQGGEVMAMEAYATRWTAGHGDYTKVVEVADFLQCKREFTLMGTDVSMLTDNVLCLISKSSASDVVCLNAMPGITIIPYAASPAVPSLPVLTEAQRVSDIVWELFGLESLFHDQKNCHELIYTGQTRIRNFRDWIEKNMK